MHKVQLSKPDKANTALPISNNPAAQSTSKNRSSKISYFGTYTVMSSPVRIHAHSANTFLCRFPRFGRNKIPLVSNFTNYVSNLLHKEPKPQNGASKPPIRSTASGELRTTMASNQNERIRTQPLSNDCDCDDDEDLYGDSDKTEHDRREFAAIQSISRDTIAGFVLSLMHPNNPHATARVTHRVEGSYHNVSMIAIKTPTLPSGITQTTHFALKIPLHGTVQHWRDGDAMGLRREAMLMKHIRHKCPNVPVPHVHHFDASLDNAIGAPYILMKKLEGRNPASQMWYDKPYSASTTEEKWRSADIPEPATEQKRITFLRSLAKAMAQLNMLEFDHIGVPDFARAEDDEPVTVGPEWNWHNKCDFSEPVLNGPYASSKEFFAQAVEKAWSPERNLPHADRTSPGWKYCIGMRKMLDMILDCEPFTWSAHDDDDQETFVLHHADLNMQNLLVADDGTLTGIIDWDGVMAMPHCVGPTAIPYFLRQDWLPDFDAGMPHLSFALGKYRKIYAEALAEYTNVRYTAKSPIYEAMLAVLEGDGDEEDVVKKLLMQIPELQMMGHRDLCQRLGAGWPAGEAFLQEKITALLKPE